MNLPQEKGPLADIKVLDFSTLLPGPMATLFLAEAGAQVVKIERPVTGDPLRNYHPKWNSDSINFAMLNKGKKSLEIDLKKEMQRKLLKPLIQEVDVVVEQFRPGVMKKLKLDFKTISKTRPDIIYCSISGYGQNGSKSQVAGHDLNYIGNTGLLALSMGNTSKPVVPPALVADIAGGSYPAILNILLALRKRDQTGKGCFIDISMSESLFPLMFWAFGQGILTGKWPKNGDSIFTGGSPRYNLYTTKDNQTLATATLEQKFWEKFCEIIKLDRFLRDDNLNPHKTIERVSEIIAKEPARHWKKLFETANCCCSIVEELQNAILDPHFSSRKIFDRKVKNSEGQTLNALPVPIVENLRCKKKNSEVPRLGEHNADFFTNE